MFGDQSSIDSTVTAAMYLEKGCNGKVKVTGVIFAANWQKIILSCKWYLFNILDGYLCRTFPVLSGGNAMDFVELSGKIVTVIKSALVRNLSDGHIGIVQQVF